MEERAVISRVASLQGPGVLARRWMQLIEQPGRVRSWPCCLAGAPIQVQNQLVLTLQPVLCIL